jgi:hypothetical protein
MRDKTLLINRKVMRLLSISTFNFRIHNLNICWEHSTSIDAVLIKEVIQRGRLTDLITVVSRTSSTVKPDFNLNNHYQLSQNLLSCLNSACGTLFVPKEKRVKAFSLIRFLLGI